MKIPQRLKNSSNEPERGDVNLIIVFLTIAAAAVIALFVNGYQAFNAHETATNLAGEAARVGAGQVSGGAVEGGTPTIDPYQAKAAADSYLKRFGVTGTVTVQGQTVTVKVTKPVTYAFLLPPGTVSAESSATAKHQLG